MRAQVMRDRSTGISGVSFPLRTSLRAAVLACLALCAGCAHNATKEPLPKKVCGQPFHVGGAVDYTYGDAVTEGSVISTPMSSLALTVSHDCKAGVTVLISPVHALGIRQTIKAADGNVAALLLTVGQSATATLTITKPDGSTKRVTVKLNAAPAAVPS